MHPIEMDDRDVELLGEVPTTREVLAKHHKTFKPLPSVRVGLPSSPVVCRWTFTERERALIAAGGDLYLATYTYGRPLQPLMAAAGVPMRWDFSHAGGRPGAEMPRASRTARPAARVRKVRKAAKTSQRGGKGRRRGK